jgi:hypothetical protein
MYFYNQVQEKAVDIFWYQFTNSTEQFDALVMEAVSTYETSVNFYQTTEDSLLHTRRRENLKAHSAPCS